ncbi:hypothetical protein ASJ36_11380 [Aeromonas sp. ARM81]|nr:hypothetical protein C2U47_20440 [Aeromonas sp. ASNIH7]KMY38746.1 hypothetical protein ACH48_07775 [Aeromonas caviae]PNO63421.1 hypothetical protein MC65_003325 [Aeromonas caviae]RDD49923.1 hypothetical protein ASJ36_11380 [Aeromonas sp. ARM81]
MIEFFNRPPRLFTATPWGVVVWEDSTMTLRLSLWTFLIASLLPSIRVPAVFRLSLWTREIVQG